MKIWQWKHPAIFSQNPVLFLHRVIARLSNVLPTSIIDPKCPVLFTSLKLALKLICRRLFSSSSWSVFGWWTQGHRETKQYVQYLKTIDSVLLEMLRSCSFSYSIHSLNKTALRRWTVFCLCMKIIEIIIKMSIYFSYFGCHVHTTLINIHKACGAMAMATEQAKVQAILQNDISSSFKAMSQLCN